MVELNTTMHRGWGSETLPQAEPDEGPLLAAAVAAVLAEYRQTVTRQTKNLPGQGFATRWRTLARQEQLRGRE